jgi:hypothetical protein
MGILSTVWSWVWSPAPKLEIHEAPRRLPISSQLEIAAQQHQEALRIAETICPCKSIAVPSSRVSVRPTQFPVS